MLLAKNEARNLPRALESLPAQARALVIDAQSQDDTVRLARARGAETIVRPWEGFVATRRFALSCVRTPWTFMLDADEALDRELSRALVALEPAARSDGFAVRRVTYFCGRPILHGAWGADAPLRLFRTARATLVARPAAGGDAELHERWKVGGTVETLAGTLSHYSYPSLAAYREKFARYTSLEARGVRGSPARVARAAAGAVLRAPWLLVVRGGWRDGWQGCFTSLASAAYPVAVAWKAWRA